MESIFHCEQDVAKEKGVYVFSLGPKDTDAEKIDITPIGDHSFFVTHLVKKES